MMGAMMGRTSGEDWEGEGGPDAEGEDARDAAAAVAALEEWEAAGRPTVSLEALRAELGL